MSKNPFAGGPSEEAEESPEEARQEKKKGIKENSKADFNFHKKFTKNRGM